MVNRRMLRREQALFLVDALFKPIPISSFFLQKIGANSRIQSRKHLVFHSFPRDLLMISSKKDHRKKPRHARYAAGASASSRDVNADGSQAIGANKLIFFFGKIRLKSWWYQGGYPWYFRKPLYYHIMLEKVGYQFLAQLGHECGYSNCDVDLVPNNIW